MEALIYIAVAAVIIYSLVGGFLAGAVAHLFGLGFWGAAIGVAAVIAAFLVGTMRS